MIARKAELSFGNQASLGRAGKLPRKVARESWQGSFQEKLVRGEYKEWKETKEMQLRYGAAKRAERILSMDESQEGMKEIEEMEGEKIAGEAAYAETDYAAGHPQTNPVRDESGSSLPSYDILKKMTWWQVPFLVEGLFVVTLVLYAFLAFRFPSFLDGGEGSFAVVLYVGYVVGIMIAIIWIVAGIGEGFALHYARVSMKSSASPDPLVKSYQAGANLMLVGAIGGVLLILSIFLRYVAAVYYVTAVYYVASVAAATSPLFLLMAVIGMTICWPCLHGMWKRMDSLDEFWRIVRGAAIILLVLVLIPVAVVMNSSR